MTKAGSLDHFSPEQIAAAGEIEHDASKLIFERAGGDSVLIAVTVQMIVTRLFLSLETMMTDMDTDKGIDLFAAAVKSQRNAMRPRFKEALKKGSH